MLSKEELTPLIEGKYINVQKHRDADLYIYNYGPKTQFERKWNDITLVCRGLILDGDMNVVARPFRKFFNLSEHDPSEIPKTSFEVFEKMDGSLGILYWVGDVPHLATRGSFESEQAVKGTSILHTKYKGTFDFIDRSKTYLFEIIYPQNRIVCDYGNTEDIVLLSVIDNATGADCEMPDIGFPVVKRHDGLNDMDKLNSVMKDSARNDGNSEGFVVRFDNGFRIKVKHEEYCRLHRIITQVSNKTIWEYLSQGKDFDELLDRVPDEFYAWVKATKKRLLAEYEAIAKEAKSHFRPFVSRKEAAEYFTRHRLAPLLFRMYDGKEISDLVWKMVKPKFEKPFSTNRDD